MREYELLRTPVARNLSIMLGTKQALEMSRPAPDH
jgi:hypothetical protein